MPAPQILLVEDDDNLREVIVDLLLDEEYQVHGAASGEEAVSWAEENAFSVVVTDVRLPGPDGLETLRRLRALGREFRSLVITGYASEDAGIRAVQDGVSDYIYKPVNLETLLDAVQRAVHEDSETRRIEKIYVTLLRAYHEAYKHPPGHPLTTEILSARNRAFKAFYVGVRCRKLDRAEGYYFWSLIEEIEEDLITLTAGKGFPNIERDYARVIDSMGAVAEEGGLMFVVPDIPTPVTRVQFFQLYQAIEQERIKGHFPLLLAPLLRRATGASAEWGPLRESLWGRASG